MAATNEALRERLAPSRNRSQTPPTDANAPAPPPVFESVATAAKKLGIDAARLRRRCLRRGQRVGDCIVALLDDGVVAFKFGPRWRIRFTQP